MLVGAQSTIRVALLAQRSAPRLDLFFWGPLTVLARTRCVLTNTGLTATRSDIADRHTLYEGLHVQEILLVGGDRQNLDAQIDP